MKPSCPIHNFTKKRCQRKDARHYAPRGFNARMRKDARRYERGQTRVSGRQSRDFRPIPGNAARFPGFWRKGRVGWKSAPSRGGAPGSAGGMVGSGGRTLGSGGRTLGSGGGTLSAVSGCPGMAAGFPVLGAGIPGLMAGRSGAVALRRERWRRSWRFLRAYLACRQCQQPHGQPPTAAGAGG